MPKIVYIAHPVSGDVEENMKKILEICSKIHRENADIIPFAPYLVACQYLRDHVIEERELGIQANIELFKRNVIDEVWLFGPKISAGMKAEIELAKKLNIPIISKNPDLDF